MRAMKGETCTSIPSPQDHYRRRVAVTMILEAELAADLWHKLLGLQSGINERRREDSEGC